jgi:hypothetical protein
MLRIPFFLFLLLASTGYAFADYSNTGDRVLLDEISTSAPLTSAALNFDVEVKLFKFNGNQEEKISEAADLIKQVVTSEEFRNFILNHKVKGKKTFIDNDGLSNRQIYKKIIEGSEKLRPGIDNIMNLELEGYSQSNSTIGYTYPSKIKVWMNKTFLNKNRPADATTNMMHEWLHKLGFKHEKERTPLRKYSVPYAVGYLVGKMANEIK